MTIARPLARCVSEPRRLGSTPRLICDRGTTVPISAAMTRLASHVLRRALAILEKTGSVEAFIAAHRHFDIAHVAVKLDSVKYHVKPIALGVAAVCSALAMVAWTHSGLALTID